MIRTLIVDDSSLVRDILRDFLESDGSFEILAEAENGMDGVAKAKELSPDLITMDIEMPVLNGLDAIREIKKFLDTAIVVISTHDTAKMAYDATVMGAMEFYAKDIFTSQLSDEKKDEIISTLKKISEVKKKAPLQQASQEQVQHAQTAASGQIKAVVIASSTGGPMALCQLFSTLPAAFPVPIFLVQHNTSGFDNGFVQWLDGYTQLKVQIAEEGDRKSVV
jgi:two-component system chemotaxis response regulator CheB